MTISLSSQEAALRGAEEMLRVTRMMSAWTAETSLFPAVVPAERAVTQVYRVGVPRELYVERGDVVQSARVMLDSIERNEVRKLVAGTGTGKSTLLPVSLVMTGRTLAIVVMPNRSLAKSIVSYVSGVVCVGARKECAVARCVDYEDVKKLCAPAVAYMAASDFLMMLASEVSVLERLRPSFVYVDEAHEQIPQYEVLQLLISAGKFSGTKVFLGSATSSSQNLERREGGVGLQVRPTPVPLLAYEHPDALPVKSPMHHSAIVDRTIVFVPSCEKFPVLARYYKDNALEVLELPEWASASDVYKVEKSLSVGSRPVVLLVTQAHQTGYTFSAETVINCGVSVDLSIDSGSMEIKLVERIATEAESIQRCGRVGRFASGVAYNFVSDKTSAGRVCTASNDCYVALWCKVLGLQVNSAPARRWSSFVEPMSMYKVCLLLSATIHPVVLAPFIADDGTVYRGTREIFLNFLRMQRKLVSTAVNIDVVLYTKLWQEQVMVVRAVPMVDPEFKSLYTVPATWTLWSYVMYHALVNGEAPAKWFAYKRSVLSTIQEGTDGVRSIYSSVGSAVHSQSERPCTPRRDSGVGKFVAGFGVPGSPHKGYPTSPLARSSFAVEQVSGLQVESKWEDREQTIPDAGRTKSWVNEVDRLAGSVAKVGVEPAVRVGDRGRLQESGRRSSSVVGLSVTPPRPTYSGRPPSYGQGSPTSPYWATRATGLLGSPEQRVVKKRRYKSETVSATSGNLGSVLLEPVGERERVQFTRLVASASQTAMYKNLKSGDVKVSMLEAGSRLEAFYCVLVMWNDAIATRLQLQAKPDSLFGTKGLALAKVERTLDRARLLLKTFDVYGYLYQHQKYRPQASPGLDLSEVQSRIDEASLAATLGNDKYRDSVALASKFATSLYVDGVRVGGAFKDGHVLFTAFHLWCNDRLRPREFELSSTAACVDQQSGVAVVNAVGGARSSSVDLVRRRAPVAGETVSLFVPLQVRVVPVGFSVVLAVGDVCIYDANMPDGVSGSPLVAHSDGAVVGIHLGALAAPDGSVYSQFAAIDEYCYE